MSDWKCAAGAFMPREIHEPLLTESDRRGHSMAWLVLRHAGRAGARWRRVFGSRFEYRSRSRYKAETEKLRAGTVALVDPYGRVLAVESAPWLRSRW